MISVCCGGVDGYDDDDVIVVSKRGSGDVDAA